MADTTKAYDVHGKRILQTETGKFIAADDALAGDLLSNGLEGQTVRAVSPEQWTAERQRRERDTLAGQVETFGRGAGEAVGDVAQIASRVAGSTPGKVFLGANPFTALPYWAMQATQGAAQGTTGVDVNAPGRAIPAQIAGVVGGGPEAEKGYAERTALLRADNPAAYAAGEFAGNIGLGLATGGVTMAAGRGMAGALVRGGVREAAAGALGMGAAMGAEGGIYGAAATEGAARAAGQTDGATAEQLIQGIGFGTLLGAGLGVAGSATSSAFSRLMQRIERPPAAAVGEAAEARMAPTVTSFDSAAAKAGAGDRLARLQAQLTGADEETIARYGAQNMTPEAVEGRALWRQRDEIVDQSVPKMVTAVDRLDEALNSVTDQVKRVQYKREGVQQMLGGINEENAMSYGNGHIAYTLQRAQTIDQLVPRRAWSQGIHDRLERFQEYVTRHMPERAQRKRPQSAADVFIACDLIKREAQHVVKNLSSLVTRSTDGNVVEGARKAMEAFEMEIQEPLRLSLENRSVWGRAGQAQKEINAAWKSDIDTSTRFSKELQVSDGAKVWADGRTRYYADSAKVKSWVQSIGTTEGQTRQQMVRQRLDSARTLLRKIDEYHGLTEDQKPVYQKAMEATTELEQELARLDKSAAVANRIEQVAQAERRAAPVVSTIGEKALGAVTGAVGAGPVGGLMGALGLLTRPATAMGGAEQLHALAARLGIRMENRAGAWIRNAGAPKEAAAPAAATAAAPTAPKLMRIGERAAGAVAPAVVSKATALFMGRDSDLEKAYQRRVNSILQAKQDPNGLMEGIASRAGEIGSYAPGIAAALVEKTQVAVDFLAAHLPSGTLSPTPLMPGRKASVPRLEMMRFAQVWAAVEKPETVLDDLERGMATPDQMAALKTVHPETYQGIRNAVVAALIDVGARKGTIPISMRQQLDLLLDLDGAGEPAFSPRVADRILALTAPPKPPASRKPPQMSRGLAMPQDRWSNNPRA